MQLQVGKVTLNGWKNQAHQNWRYMVSLESNEEDIYVVPCVHLSGRVSLVVAMAPTHTSNGEEAWAFFFLWVVPLFSHHSASMTTQRSPVFRWGWTMLWLFVAFLTSFYDIFIATAVPLRAPVTESLSHDAPSRPLGRGGHVHRWRQHKQLC